MISTIKKAKNSKTYKIGKKLFNELFDDKIGYYASSLSWNTLFSIIPLLAILLYVFTTLPIFDSVYKNVEDLIFHNLMPTNSKVIMEYINKFIDNSAELGLVGFFYVSFAAIMFFKNYDYIVNDIFEAPKRGIFHGFRTYLMLITVLPLMLGTSFYLSSFIQSYLDKNSITGMIHLYFFLPYIVIWGVFYVAYQISANTKIDKKAALISSFVSSVVWYSSKSGFVFYVIHNKTYASVYGSISTILFFFLWIYISWAIFLYGLRFCYMLDTKESP